MQSLIIRACTRADARIATRTKCVSSARPSRSRTTVAGILASGERQPPPRIVFTMLIIMHSRFDSWNKADGVEVGSPEYYGKQYYTQGTKCWNGPFRNVVVRSTSAHL